MFRGELYVTFSRTSQAFGKRGSHRADKPANEEQRGLETVSSFAFQGEQGSFTASKEHSGSKRGGRNWKAHRKRNGKRAVVYLGKSERLTLERLKVAAGKMPSGYRFRLTLFLGSGRNFRLILNLTRLWPFLPGLTPSHF